MHFSDHLEGGVAVFELSGRMTGGADATLFYGRLHEYLNLNKKSILLDLNKVPGTNSLGLGMLISARETVKSAGGRLALTNVHHVESLLALTKLLTVFENFDSPDEAIKAMES